MQQFNFTYWHENEPSGTDPNTGVEEDCVAYYNHNNETKWNDVSCENEYEFICESLDNL